MQFYEESTKIVKIIKNVPSNYQIHLILVRLTLKNKKYMIRWIVIFLVIAIIAAIFGFGGIAAGAAGIAKIIFYIFLVLLVLSLLSSLFRR